MKPRGHRGAGCDRLTARRPADYQIDDPPFLIESNMGFQRSILERVSAFGPDREPGALGFGGATLFSMQLVEAGFKIEYAPKKT